MRRLLLILLTLILPFQFAWAGAAAYCQHEAEGPSAAAVQHFGHHQHQHSADSPGGDQKKALVDIDCGICHIASIPFACTDQPSAQTVQRIELVATPPAQHFTSHCATAPDRPQWQGLA
ncbi:cobalt-zinc-cadmium resistance protein [Cupriavidus respiraculi]|uniref:cation efflux protein, CzcI family n=1 Tax=Cupriavidus respiraculi TaxID=195930 RepID=UPI001C988DEB|nr:cation efflux protein, CzcI family [Cupriavidus respiraculi]MBY4949494.1 cobalt-zinc-cadmium resistance protein [Cupriavidus respiraculi]